MRPATSVVWYIYQDIAKEKLDKMNKVEDLQSYKEVEDMECGKIEQN